MSKTKLNMADVQLANDAKCNYSAIIAALSFFFFFKFTSTSEANVDLPDVYLTCTKRLSLARTHIHVSIYISQLLSNSILTIFFLILRCEWQTCLCLASSVKFILFQWVVSSKVRMLSLTKIMTWIWLAVDTKCNYCLLLVLLSLFLITLQHIWRKMLTLSS